MTADLSLVRMVVILALVAGWMAPGGSTHLVLDAAESQALPAGALAHYEFADAAASVIPNRVQTAGALPALTLRGSDYQVSNEEIRWNAGIGNFTHTLPFDASRGTFADTPVAFANSFVNGGTFGIRLRLDPTVVASLGQASLVGAVTFRPSPDSNVHSTPPRSLEFRRYGSTEPLVLLAREGSATTGYQNQFNDEVESGPLSDPSAEDLTAVVVWTPQMLRIYVDGVIAGTRNRVTTDYPASAYRLFVAVNQFVVHSGDLQFFKGAMKSLVVYDRALNDADVWALTDALNATGPSPRIPSAPTNLRIIP